jgi:hypothetical protein
VKIAKGLLWMALGYGAAVLVATFVTIGLIVVASAAPDNGRFGSFYKVLSNVAPAVPVGLIITSVTAFPGWLSSVALAARRSILTRRYFVISGGLTAVLAHLLYSGLSGGYTNFVFTGDLGGILLWSVIGGLCGGFAYWRVAVVRFGRWRLIS